ncbi:MAG: Gfo/Idh/MocA family oxidoreductase [Candidatus Saganbacteria bacterium]|nr:Gfo/Idh/MocA family oxidoreductase [Candidatus Saganbacteria bacterium]
MAKVKVGVIGCGKMGTFHANILNNLKEAKLIGLFDLDQAKAQAEAERLKVKHYESYELLLKDIEAVIIATPTPSHKDIARDCILSGKHVLIEKPIAENSDQAKELLELANGKKLKCTVGMIERFNPSFQKLVRMIKGQKIIGMEIKRLSPYPERIKESVVFDMMIHDIDLASKVGRTGVEDIRAYGKKKRSDTLDEVLATLYFKDGMIAKIDASRIKNHKERKITITTEKGIYEADLLNKKLSVRGFDDLTKKEEVEIKQEDQLTLELRNFLISIQKDRQPEISLEQATRSLITAEEVEKTACS